VVRVHPGKDKEQTDELTSFKPLKQKSIELARKLLMQYRKNWLFVGSDKGGEPAAICFGILAGAKRHRIEPFAYLSALLIALSWNEMDLASLLPDVGIAAHPEHFLTYRRDAAEAAARARKWWREKRRAESKTRLPAG
jgi:hypothetical protein